MGAFISGWRGGDRGGVIGGMSADIEWMKTETQRDNLWVKGSRR